MICDFAQLDAVPKQLHRVVPVYPRESRVNGVADTIEVEFFVDTEGQVQLPHTIKAINQELA